MQENKISNNNQNEEELENDADNFFHARYQQP